MEVRSWFGSATLTHGVYMEAMYATSESWKGHFHGKLSVKAHDKAVAAPEPDLFVLAAAGGGHAVRKGGLGIADLIEKFESTPPNGRHPAGCKVIF